MKLEDLPVFVASLPFWS